MAKQIQGVLGGFSGRVGSVIGYRRGGRWCLRSMPQQVHNPRTEAQQRHRSVFRAEVQLAARMRWPVAMCLTQPARERHMTAQNLFVRLNNGCFRSAPVTDGSDAACRVDTDYGRLQLSLGPLAPVAVTGAVAEPLGDGGALALTVGFDPCLQGRRAGRYDEVYLYAYSPGAGAGYLFNSVYRYTKRVTALLPDWLQCDDLQLYLMCRSSRGEWSATVHAALDTKPDTDANDSESLRGHADSRRRPLSSPCSNSLYQTGNEPPGP